MTRMTSNWRLSVRETGDQDDPHEIVITEFPGPNGPSKRVAWDMARNWAAPHQSRIVVLYLDGTTKTAQPSGNDLDLAQQSRDEVAAENAWLKVAENAGEDCPDWAR